MGCQQLSSRHVTGPWASLLLETPLTDSTSMSDDDRMRRNPFAVKWMKVHSPDDALRSAPLRQ